MADVLIGLGANLGNRKQSLQSALGSLKASAEISIVAVSSLYESTPVGGPDGQPPFLNAVARLSTSLSPHELLEHMHAIETSLGRQRNEHWAARTIDLDILLCDNQIVATQDLQIPHRWMALRSFVLDPASEIAADMIHPELRCSIEELRKNFHSQRPYCVIAGASAFDRFFLACKLSESEDVYLLMRGSTFSELKKFTGELFADKKETELTRDSRNLMQRPLVFVDDYTQPNFKPEKNWIKFRIADGRKSKIEAAIAPTSLVPKIRLRICPADEVWQELPNAPKYHWDYLRAIPVPTMNIVNQDGQFDNESAKIGLAVCLEPEKFYTKKLDESLSVS